MKKISAKKFDKAFDQGKDISALLDKKTARRVNEEQKRVNIDFPKWMVENLDREAGRLGITRQALIKVWIAERFDNIPAAQAR